MWGHKKTLWKKEKSLETSPFSLSHNVFKRLLSQGHKSFGLRGQGLRVLQCHLLISTNLQNLDEQDMPVTAPVTCLVP